ncbi:hypothetical protein RHMOL_Rhmol07G0182500 [Rhododendron molle]|uniref:Uncharacterized protein n=1 Tax=Rhododendron molle TaxID=49168 RepID=A0ACC0N1U0_RHOML|nr:hypothetical protein RHMOL_Rhmol07G0182500 [Rhododendron molle]
MFASPTIQTLILGSKPVTIEFQSAEMLAKFVSVSDGIETQLAHLEVPFNITISDQPICTIKNMSFGSQKLDFCIAE